MVETLPLSALQHLLFCPRQCALIHVERVWEENHLTAEGRVMHETVDGGRAETRPGIRIVRSMQLLSRELGLHGVADVVELHTAAAGTVLPFPVEYKRGKPKLHRADEVQLCAQAWCLEEMFGVPVPAGALFYGQNRRRLDVEFDPPFRAVTAEAAARLHALLSCGETPAAVREKKCDACSLLPVCLPGAMSRPRGAAAWNTRAFFQALDMAAGQGGAVSEKPRT